MNQINIQVCPKCGAGSVLDNEEEGLAAGYHDNCDTEKLRTLLNNTVELERINTHRGTNMAQDELNRVLRYAIHWRECGIH